MLSKVSKTFTLMQKVGKQPLNHCLTPVFIVCRGPRSISYSWNKPEPSQLKKVLSQATEVQESKCSRDLCFSHPFLFDTALSPRSSFCNSPRPQFRTLSETCHLERFQSHSNTSDHSVSKEPSLLTMGKCSASFGNELVTPRPNEFTYLIII